jgi:hypothetical protein
MNQKEATYTVVTGVLAEHGIDFEGGDASKLLTTEMRTEVVALISELFREGKVDLSDTPANQHKLQDQKEMSKYVVGLVNNWLRKDQRLNGGTKYQAKNPGVRSGTADEQLKALGQLKAKLQVEGMQDKVTEVEKYIEARKQELRAEQAKKFTVDMSKVPAELKEKLGL